ncbi:MAG TPA: AAA family ATPase, partial [Polyangiaceae bacterium]|nr:AAA family ATPase [Polyangiaceae bacterium]
MRLLELSLLSYGPFSDEVLAFADDPALEVVYGPNEAGKSTALRAITGFFYGIPEKTSDDHLHEKARLRIGGRLRDGRGDVLAAVRRKGRKATLLDADNRPLDEMVMQRALGGVSRELFLTMFGLDHRTLAEGAQALLRGEGHVGESLFDAGGARGVGDVLARLREEADALFKPRGTTPKLNEALREHKEAKQLIVLKETLPRGYLDQKQRFQEAQKNLAGRVAARQELGIEKNRLDRLLRVQPHLARRRDLLERRALLGDVAHLSQDASERRLEAQRQLDACERDRARLESE